jgi:hypothetical protein
MRSVVEEQMRPLGETLGGHLLYNKFAVQFKVGAFEKKCEPNAPAAEYHPMLRFLSQDAPLCPGV